MNSMSRTRLCAIGACFTLIVAVPGRAAERSGAEIFRTLCADCHGAKGEGNPDHFARPLQGDLSVDGLAKLIDRTMPEGEPEKLNAAESRRVAEYVHDSFYSKIAQARNKPPRVELARLTVRQYQNTVADLVGAFRYEGKWDDKRGLRAEYFKGRIFRTDQRVIERLDPTLNFQFGEGTPDPKITGKEFAIRWIGSLLAPESGEYEIILQSHNGVQIWLNNNRRALIDAHVQSGTNTEHKATIRLLAGRAYPVRIELTRFNEKKSSFTLAWKRPHRPVEVVDTRFLLPYSFPPSFVLETPFPPDDRSVGYERGNAISKAWDQAATDSALEVAEYVVKHLNDLAGIRRDANANDRAAKVREYAKRFATHAFRRPLTPSQQTLFVDSQFQPGRDDATALKRVVLLVLKSPRFLYREIHEKDPDDFDVAARLAFGLYDSLPDQTLVNAAQSKRLDNRQQIAQQAERLLGDLRTRGKVREFFRQWLHVDRFEDLTKNNQLYPGFDEEVVADLHTSLDLFVEDAIWGKNSDFRQLLLSEKMYLNGRLAKFYNVKMPENAPFQQVLLDPHRAGVLSHPYIMAGFAYHSGSSPIHRGVFVARTLLGRTLAPPPIAVAPLPPTLHPNLTTRERVMLQTKPAACVSCHALINDLGFALEQFDAVGRFRDREKNKTIDASGVYHTIEGKDVRFDGARSLAHFLANSPEVQAAFVEQLFHFMIKQPIRAYGPDAEKKLRESFARDGYNVRKLLVEIVTFAATVGPARVGSKG